MTDSAPVKVPQELLGASATALEDYVRSRLLQFIKRFGISLGQLLPGVTPALLDRAVHDTLRALPAPDYGQVPLEQRQLQLVFRHDCQALGCLEPQCPLCQHNSKRRCTVNFCKKYLVNDRMLARCGAQIRVEVIDRATGRLCDSDLSGIHLEVFVLNGATYDQRFLDATRTSSLARADSSNPDSVFAMNKDLDDCALLSNNKGKPLLTSLVGGKASEDGKLLIQAVRGRVVLPDLTVTDSSEALLSGRKPPFRLVVRAKHKAGQFISLRPAVSEAFVVATRRVRTSHKADIPTMDDPVAKLMHMGKETCRKLGDLPTAAQQANLELELEEQLACIEKVGDFKALAVRAEADAQLRQQLQTLLKLPKDKWDEAVEHAKRAVFPDNRPRAWYDRTASVGLLFPATLGVVDLKRPEALLQRVLDPSGVNRLQVVPQQQQTAMQRDAVRRLLPQAEECWWSPGHTGWTLFDPDAMAAAAALSLRPSPAGLGPLPQQLPPLPTPGTPAGKGLLMSSPAAVAAAGSSFGSLATQLLPAFNSTAMPGMSVLTQEQVSSQLAAAAAASQGIPGAAPAAALQQQPGLATRIDTGLQQQQQHQQQQQQMLVGNDPSLPPESPLQQGLTSSFSRPAWMGPSAAAHSPTPQQQQLLQQQQQQQQQALTAAAQAAASPQPALQQAMAATPPRPSSTTPTQARADAAAGATPQTPAIPSAFAALAAQPISATDSPQGPSAQQPPSSTAAAAAAGAADTTPAAAARAVDAPGISSSGLDSSLQQSRSSGAAGSLLPPLAGRKRSFAIASGGTAEGNAAPTGRGFPSSAAAASTAALPARQLSADMEKLLNAAGFNPSLPGPLRDAPSLTAFPSMGLFLDTVSPAAAAGGGTGATLLTEQRTSAAAPNRAASAGLSRLLSLDLALLLRGTSLLPATGAAGGEGSGGVGGLGLPMLEDDGLPTPHAAAAAEGLMALADPLGGNAAVVGAAPGAGVGPNAAGGAGQPGGPT